MCASAHPSCVSLASPEVTSRTASAQASPPPLARCASAGMAARDSESPAPANRRAPFTAPPYSSRPVCTGLILLGSLERWEPPDQVVRDFADHLILV